jgi:hypothetical protein
MRNYLAPSSKTEITPTTSTTITTVATSRLLPQKISMEASNSTYSSNSTPITTSKQTSTSNSSSSSTKHRWYHNRFPIDPKSLPIGHRRRKPKILTVAVAMTKNNFSTDPNEYNEIHDVSVVDKLRSLSFHEDHHPSYR